MLNAREFVEINLEQIGTEESRLESLHAQISKQTLSVKQRLTREFLAIVEDRTNRCDIRVQACNILGGRREDLGITGSRLVTDRLQKILEKEFVNFRHLGSLGRRGEIHLRKMSLLDFTILKVLLVTLYRIDYGNTHKFVNQIVEEVSNPWRTDLNRLLTSVVQKLK